MKSQLALVIDGRRARRGRLARVLEDSNIVCRPESSLDSARQELSRRRYNALLVSENVARDKLEDFCLRARAKDPALIVVASLTRQKPPLEERLLDDGVDDVVTDSTPTSVIAKRIVVRLFSKRQLAALDRTVRLRETIVDFKNLEVWNRGKVRPISRGLAHLLQYLIGKGGQVLTRQEAADILWSHAVVDPEGKNLDMQISKLRRLIEVDPKRPALIQTVRGLGYRFLPQATAEGEEEGGELERSGVRGADGH